jgi:hypothetical protein
MCQKLNKPNTDHQEKCAISSTQTFGRPCAKSRRDEHARERREGQWPFFFSMSCHMSATI